MDEQSNISNLSLTHTESTHLLVFPSLSSSATKPPCRNTSSNDNHSIGHHNSGTATKGATILNIMKTCMGTGTLALPFACQQGGILLNTFGLLAIASWNLYSVQRLCQSWHYLPSSSVVASSSSSLKSEEHNVVDYEDDTSKCYTVQTKATNRFGSTNLSFEDIPSNISTFGKVAWLAFGDIGIHGLDIVLVILFLGIIVAYEGNVNIVIVTIVETFFPLFLHLDVNTMLIFFIFSHAHIFSSSPLWIFVL
jgi:Transmembrane amino acid transporter protein